MRGSTVRPVRGWVASAAVPESGGQHENKPSSKGKTLPARPSPHVVLATERREIAPPLPRSPHLASFCYAAHAQSTLQ